jgi:peptidoglycan/xylan/chitin deacetylase (PgdA/CDA1 family)
MPETTTATSLSPSAFVALMYHNVGPDGEPYADLSPSATSYFVSRTAFDQQLAVIAEQGGEFMTWEDLRRFYGSPVTTQDGSYGGGAVPTFLTFDDGWLDTCDVGGPVLESRGARAIVFVTTDFIGKPRFLSRQQLSRLPANVFRVGSHAQTHRMLSLLSDEEIRGELADSKKFLEDAMGYEIDALSVPSGAVDGRVRRIANESGYRLVFDSEVRVNRRGDDPLSIGRVAIMHDTPLPAVCRYARGQLGRERARRAVLQFPKRVLGLKRYERLRRRLLRERQGQKVTHES